ncbi:unnamed protein product [Paramecium sonneborni]|uniref:Uncharacterized protein n=1 Tax=Paramecium sonneborni TaxID=65129 RepID=A0A8S1N936_9CILI|nr:unnamed protein product [Paramecium sonneborni]
MKVLKNLMSQLQHQCYHKIQWNKCILVCKCSYCDNNNLVQRSTMKIKIKTYIIFILK